MSEVGPQAAATASLDVQLLGPVRAVGEQISTLTGRRPAGLLAILALNAGERVGVDEIVEAVWGEQLPANVRHGLHALASTLRGVLGPDLVESHRGTYRLVVNPLQVDAIRFRQLVEDAERERPVDALQTLRRALGLWRGQPLAGAPETVALEAAAAGLEEQRMRTLERRFELELELGRSGDITGELTELVRAHPLREWLRAQLMTALYQSGRQADALGLYRDGRAILADQLGIEPSRELKELEQAILRQDASLMPRAQLALVDRDRLPLEDALALVESWTFSTWEWDDAAFAALDADYARIVRSLEETIASRDREGALRLVAGMRVYWFLRGDHERADAWIQQALALPGDVPHRVEYNAIVAAGEIARVRGEHARAAQLKEQALTLVDAAGVPEKRGALLADLAHIRTHAGDLAEAEALSLAAIAAREQAAGPSWTVAHAVLALAEVREYQERYDEAIELYEQSIAGWAEHGYEGEVALIKGRLLSRALRARGDVDRVSATCRAALAHTVRTRELGTITIATQGLAWVATERDDIPAAARLLASVSGDAYQAPLEPHERDSFRLDVERARTLGGSAFEPAWRVGLSSPPVPRPAEP